MLLLLLMLKWAGAPSCMNQKCCVSCREISSRRREKTGLPEELHASRCGEKIALLNDHEVP